MKDFLETWTMQVKQWQNATKIVALYPAIPFRPRYDVSECASAQALRSKAGIYRMMWSNMLSMFGKDLHCFAISCYHGVQNNVHWHTPSINQWLHMSSLSDTYANSYIYIYIYVPNLLLVLLTVSHLRQAQGLRQAVFRLFLFKFQVWGKRSRQRKLLMCCYTKLLVCEK